MFKILQASLQQYMNWELPVVQARFRKGRETRCQISKIHWIIEKQENSRKTSTSTSLDHNKLWKILQEMRIPDYLTCLLRNLYTGQEATVRTGHGKTNWLQIGKEYVKAVYCHPAYLIYMQNTSWEMSGWMKPKLESTLLGEISVTSDMHKTPPLWQRVKKN